MMFKLSIANTSSLFSLEAEVSKRNQEERWKQMLRKEYPVLGSVEGDESKSVVDAYLLHFLKEVDADANLKTSILKKLMSKKEEKLPKVGDLGELEPMRVILKRDFKQDIKKSADKVYKMLGTSVKTEIQNNKKEEMKKRGEDIEADDIEEKLEKIIPQDLIKYDGVAHVKYLDYVHNMSNKSNGEINNEEELNNEDNELSYNDDEELSNEDEKEDYINTHLDHISEENEDHKESFNQHIIYKKSHIETIQQNEFSTFSTKKEFIHQENFHTFSSKKSSNMISFKSKKEKHVTLTNNDFNTIPEKNENEFDDTESKFEREMKRDLEDAKFYKKDKKKKKKKKQRTNNQQENVVKKLGEDKKFKLFEYDIHDSNMKFTHQSAPNKIKSISTGHTIWLSATYYIFQKNLFITGGYDDHIVKIWRINKNTLDMKKIGEYRGHKGHITTIQYNSQKDYLMIGSQDCSFSIISLAKIPNREINKDILLEDSVVSVAEIEHRYSYN